MTSEPRPALFDSVEKIAYAYTENTDASLAISEAIMLLIEAVRAEQAAEIVKERERADKFMWQVRDTCARAERAEQELAKWKEQRLLDHGRLLWREDVETHCPNADLCFEYSATVRCSPCAIKQSDAEGVEALSLNNVYQPEVARLNRELAKFKALAETLAGALGEIAQPDFGYTDILERGCWRERTAREALTSYKEARDAS